MRMAGSGKEKGERMLPRLIFLTLILLPLAAPRGDAQQGEWQNLAQLKTGQTVKVIDHKKNALVGEFVRFTETDLTMIVNKQAKTIDRDSVARVTTSGGHRRRNAVIGLAAGAAVGGAFAGCCIEHKSDYAGTAAGSVGGLGAIGAGIGALISGNKTVYRAGERQQAATPAIAPAAEQAFS